ncbi:outer membrane lipoprotein-sorting protein [Alteromonas sp. a30]|uniref:outer membrane lipoprotein-sorting protein n=1 Tax=Alteromonas sp. a30 TaxID=2730917 RepID=UPI00228232D5|nr:outer membrane lipoprotein-sorting protein [Alteromonas sp. a30]MCY7294079.1 outer membrane lipoprotein-sorting protein [Alteromonas sp. a30]
MKYSFLMTGIQRPWTSLLIGIFFVVVFAIGLTKLHKDTRADAFLSPQNPVLVYKDKVKEIFGLSDPIVVAIEDRSAAGVYSPNTLALIDELTRGVNAIQNVNEDKTLSLTLAKNIVGTREGLEVEPFLNVFDERGSQAMRQAIKDFPLYDGTLVADDGKMVLIVIELMDNDIAQDTYEKVMALTESAKRPAGVKIHVAGEGAVLGYLSHYIDQDASRLNPLGLLAITLMLIVAFRKILPALLGNFVIFAAIAITVGMMSFNSVPFYVITNAMPVILIGIAVADSIHIFSHYYECQAKYPDKTAKECIEEAVSVMWKPITLTTVTTMAGFLGLYVAAYMPPFEYFGLFTAIGVFVAWAYSIFVLPALITLTKPKVSKRWIKLQSQSRNDIFAKIMMLFGRIAMAKPSITILLFACLAVVGLRLSQELVVNENRIDSFHTDEPLYQADKAINRYMDGTNTIDIVIETQVRDGIFNTDVLRHMEALQAYAESLPHINGSMSVVDYLKQMNKSLNEGKQDYYKLPETKEQVAQYFLIYSASSAPTDFDNLINYDYRLANIRLHLDTSEFVTIKPVVEALEAYIKQHFTNSKVSANLSGRVTVNYHWIKDLGDSHILSVTLALTCVLIVSSLLFGSLFAGTLSILPVACSIMVVYAAMVLRGVDLGIGTSMFASVAIGLGVDFAIHTIDRLKTLLSHTDGDIKNAIYELYPSTGRALLFNYLAIAFGFGVLIISKVVPLNNFGIIVVLAVSMSFLASITLIPAIVLFFKPSFFFTKKKEAVNNHAVKAGYARGLVVFALLGMGLWGYSRSSDAVELDMTVEQVMQKVDSVDEGKHVISNLKMTMVNKDGTARMREALAYRKNFEGERRTFLVFKSPANVDGTSFLTYDYKETDREDDQWLYLPSLRKVRRISSSDRGDYFLGTDFTYEDIKKSGKIEIADYDFTLHGLEHVKLGDDQIKAIKIQAIPKSEDIERELGFGKSILWVNPVNWIIVRVDYEDRKGRPLRTYVATEIRKVEGVWSKHQVEVQNHKTGHYSRFEFSNLDYKTVINDGRFNKRSMKKS